VRRAAAQRRGFSLTEMLVVVATVAALTAIITPALSRAKRQGRGLICRSNLRQLAIAAAVYIENNDGRYPPAYNTLLEDDRAVFEAWDFTTTKDYATGRVRVVPGTLWEGQTIEKIHQCPSFHGSHNWLADPYTGYNYNTSYIGHGSGETIQTPARAIDVVQPAHCALFGDGGYAAGANKFMRAPWPSDGDQFFGRAAGTQAYRHLGRTNVAYADGHTIPTAERYTETDPAEKPNIAENTGFLSPDNSAYDLR